MDIKDFNRYIITTIAGLVIIFIVLLISQSCNKHKEVAVETQEVQDNLTELEIELITIQEENRLCNIIGAYTILNTDVTKPTPENVYTLITLCDCWYPDILIAQYIIESGSGTSKMARENHNLFGMKKAFSRKTVRCRDYDKSGYAIYNNWQLSVIDRIFWEEHVFKNKKPTREEYLKKISSIYAEDKAYIQKLEKVIKDNNL